MPDMKLMTISIYILSGIIQLLAFIIAIKQIKKVSAYKLGWVLLSIGLLLMLARRVDPIFTALINNSYHLNDAILALIISLFLMFGVFWIQKLFDLMKNQELMLVRQAKYDNLTGVLSRFAILDQGVMAIERCIRLKKPIAVLVVDLDKFKFINDTYGHSAGDQLLKEFATIGSKSFRSIDFFGRLGGDEFLAVLPEVEMDVAIKIAERVKDKVSCSEILFEQRSLRITTSIGIAYFNPNSPLHSEAETSSLLLDYLIKTADLNMYDAKKKNGNVVNYSAYSTLHGISVFNSSE